MGKDKIELIDGSFKPWENKFKEKFCALHYVKNISKDKPCEYCLKWKLNTK